MQIREATKEDIKVLGVIGKPFIDNSISSRFVSFNGDLFVKFLNTLIESGIAKVWVPKHGNRIVGAICCIFSPNIYNKEELLAEIMFIDVIPEYRKKGIATKLIDVAEEYAKKQGVKSISMVFKHKEIADKIMENCGYTMFEYKIIKRLGE